MVYTVFRLGLSLCYSLEKWKTSIKQKTTTQHRTGVGANKGLVFLLSKHISLPLTVLLSFSLYLVYYTGEGSGTEGSPRAMKQECISKVEQHLCLRASHSLHNSLEYVCEHARLFMCGICMFV